MYTFGMFSSHYKMQDSCTLNRTHETYWFLNFLTLQKHQQNKGESAFWTARCAENTGKQKVFE